MIIEVHVRTNSREQKVIKMSKKHYQVFLHSSPEKGKANKELIACLAEFFDVSKSTITIKRGLTAINKVIELSTIN